MNYQYQLIVLETVPNTKQVECGLFLFKKGKNRVGRLLELEKNTKNKEKQSFSCST